jgi:hypothetical protein
LPPDLLAGICHPVFCSESGLGSLSCGGANSQLCSVATIFRIIAALISFPTRCLSVGSGTANQTESTTHGAVIRVYDKAGKIMIETNEHAGGFKEP